MKKIISLLSLIAVLFLSTAFAPDASKFEISKNLEIFSNVYKELNSWYVDDLDPAQFMRTGIDAMMASLDPYTNYYSESQIESYRYQNESRFDGVGANLEIIDGLPTIVEPYENSPAIQAGLIAGDKIHTINGFPTEGKSIEEVEQILRGVPGTEVQLGVKHPGASEMKDILLIRGEVDVPNVPYAGFVSDDVGYIALTTFTREAGRNVANALRDLKTENPDIKGVILDLRGNGGGLLREAVSVSNVFLPRNELIVSTRGKVLERDQSYKTTQDAVDTEIPLVVLVDENSASASEIVSGAVQDLDRGVLLGQRTYGKGLVQNTREVGYNARIKMTTSKYYIPSGRCIQSVQYAHGEPEHIPDEERAEFKTRRGRTVLDGGGVKPDIELILPEEAEVIGKLREEHLIFKFVTEYCVKHESIPEIENFEFNEFDNFLQYVKKNNFTYTSEAETELAELRASLKGLTDAEDSEASIKKIEASILKDKQIQVEKNRERIIDLIEQDISGRFYFQEGKTRQRLKNDPELSRAIQLLKNTSEYKKILS